MARPYAIKDGISGGQTLTGGTGSGENLTLRSTSHATKGKIIFGTSAYDEVNNRLGIGTTSPSATLDVAGSATVNGLLTASGGAGNSHVLEATDTATNTTRGINVRHTTTGAMVDGFGGSVRLQVRDSDAVTTTVVVLESLRNGADNTADFSVQTANAGTVARKLLVGFDGRLESTSDRSGFGATIFNDGNNANRQGLIIQCGEDTPASATSATFAEFREGDGTATGNIVANAAGAVSFNDTSDERRKRDVAPTQVRGLDTVLGLNLIEFRRVKNYTVESPILDERGNPIREEREHVYAKAPIGFSAQNCQAVFPSMVNQLSDGTLAVSKAELVPVLVKAVQELAAEVRELRARVPAGPPGGPR